MLQPDCVMEKTFRAGTGARAAGPFWRQFLIVAFWAIGCQAAAQEPKSTLPSKPLGPPKQVLVTREAQDIYRVASGPIYIKTLNCYEQIYGDRADLKLFRGSKGGTMIFRSGRVCAIAKFLREVDPYSLEGVWPLTLF